MTCHNCRIDCAKDGRRPDGQQRYRCNQCGKKFSDRKEFGWTPQRDDLDQIVADALAWERMLTGKNSARS